MARPYRSSVRHKSKQYFCTASSSSVSAGMPNIACKVEMMDANGSLCDAIVLDCLARVHNKIIVGRAARGLTKKLSFDFPVCSKCAPGERVIPTRSGSIVLCCAIAHAAPGDRRESIDKMEQIGVTISPGTPGVSEPRPLAEAMILATQGMIRIRESSVHRGSA